MVPSESTSGLENEKFCGASHFRNIREYCEFEKELGEGKFGTVWSCIDSSGQRMACKSIKKSKLKTEFEIRDLRTEIFAMKAVKGDKNIVSLQKVIEDSQGIHILMDLCEEKDLFELICTKRRFSEKDAATIIRQIASGLRHCHKNGIIHRDLKPENILLDEIPNKNGVGNYSIKIADFGLASVFNPFEKLCEMAGSPFYMAPEVVQRKPYGFEVDVWSMGVILYSLLSGSLPFYGVNPKDTFSLISRGNPTYRSRGWKNISPDAISLVKRMLTVDQSKRATVIDVLSHPWLHSQKSMEYPALIPIKHTFLPVKTILPSLFLQESTADLKTQKSWETLASTSSKSSRVPSYRDDKLPTADGFCLRLFQRKLGAMSETKVKQQKIDQRSGTQVHPVPSGYKAGFLSSTCNDQHESMNIDLKHSGSQAVLVSQGALDFWSVVEGYESEDSEISPRQ